MTKLLALLAMALAAAPPVPLRTWSPAPVRWTAGGVSVAIVPEPCVRPRERCDPAQRIPAVTVAGRGLAPARWRGLPVDGRGYPPLRAAIGQLDRRDRLPAVLLDQYEGGAHCCERLTVFVARHGRWRQVDLSEFDTQEVSFPRDLSGDGRADFVLPDDGFDYAFGSFADSYAPPRVFNIVGTQVVDVSRRPAFAALFRRDMARTRALCEQPGANRSPNGACAAYAADAARLGRLAEAWPVVLRSYDRDPRAGWPEGCRIPPPPTGCPAWRKLTYASYPQALRGFLREQGYLS